MWYGFGSQTWMMWAAGLLAAISSITYPAIHVYISTHTDVDKQGKLQIIQLRMFLALLQRLSLPKEQKRSFTLFFLNYFLIDINLKYFYRTCSGHFNWNERAVFRSWSCCLWVHILFVSCRFE